MKATKYYKGYKVRLFPAKEQEELMWKHIHACRYLWNIMLEEIESQYYIYGNIVNFTECCKYISESRSMYDWINEISLHTLQYTCKDLHNAFHNFFIKKCKYPKFKSKKRCNKTFPVRSDYKRFYFKDDFVKIEKLGKIKCKSKNLQTIILYSKIYNAKVSYVNKKWILSFSVECESQALELTEKSIGIDLGIKELATCSFGGEQIVFHNINKSRKVKQLERKLKHIQRNLSRKYLKCNKDEYKRFIKSKNILREEEKLREIYYRLTNIRNNHIHQITHKIIMLRPKRIVMEDIYILSLIKNKSLSKQLLECKFGEFIYRLRYKCLWNNIEFLQVPRFYPSSKTCSNCGAYKKDLKLKDRVYVCSECGLVIDRDFNAARNLENYVLEQQ